MKKITIFGFIISIIVIVFLFYGMYLIFQVLNQKPKSYEQIQDEKVQQIFPIEYDGKG